MIILSAVVLSLAGVLKNTGIVHGAVVCGEGNIDEIILHGKTKISELKDGSIKTYDISPGDFGIKTSPIEAIKGGSAEDNAAVMKEVFEGKRKDAYYDVTRLNAGFALFVGGIADTPLDGVEKATQAIDNGSAAEKLKKFVECSG